MRVREYSTEVLVSFWGLNLKYLKFFVLPGPYPCPQCEPWPHPQGWAPTSAPSQRWAGDRPQQTSFNYGQNVMENTVLNCALIQVKKCERKKSDARKTIIFLFCLQIKIPYHITWIE
jgi:hypothetical protein